MSMETGSEMYIEKDAGIGIKMCIEMDIKTGVKMCMDIGIVIVGIDMDKGGISKGGRLDR